MGRYVILETLGAGAMGIVYGAYDRDLGRKVALKLLRAATGEGTRARLLREAQALARLSHPNVVAVHVLGTDRGRVFLAMELVEGETLAAWLRRARPTRNAVVHALVCAGRGLAAAHQAELVHRDLKPTNVLVSAGGRVCVTDFGLAHGVDDLDAADGAMVGTPAYMAPELREGARADARSDQYAFCVALHEALCGQRPPAGADALPRWIRAALRRGLAAAPEARFPDMKALLARLDAGPLVTPRRSVIAAVSLLAVTIAAALAVRAPRPMCDGAESAWGDVWGAADRSEVAAAFSRSARPGEDTVFARVDETLAIYRAHWVTSHTETCRATRVRGEQSEALLDLRMRCLADRRGEAVALVRVLASASPDTVDNAPLAAARLTSIDTCDNARSLSEIVPMPTDTATRVAIGRAKEQIARLRALERTDVERFAKALPELTATGPIPYPPLEAEVLRLEGSYEMHMQRLEPAIALFQRAAVTAVAARDDAAAADAWSDLVRAVGEHGDLSGAEQWAEYARAAIARSGGDDEREATRLMQLGYVYYFRARRLEDATDLLQRARALFVRVRGPSYVLVGRVDRTLSEAAFEMGHVDEGLAAIHRSEDIELRWGPSSAWTGITFVDEANELLQLGRLGEAEGALDRAATMFSLRGDDGWYRHRRARLLRAKGDVEGALGEDRRSYEIYASHEGGDEVLQAWPLTGEGLDWLALGRPEEAVAPLERAAVLRRKAPGSAELGETLFALARALGASKGASARARTIALEARAAYEPLSLRYGVWYGDEVRDIDVWLAARPPGP